MKLVRGTALALLCCAAVLDACTVDRDGRGGTVAVGGAAVEGDVTADDRAQPAGWAAPITADVWHVTLAANMPVTILLCSTMPNADFDPYLQLDLMGNEIANDDDSALNQNARIAFTPASGGDYTVYVMNSGGTSPVSASAYSLRVLQGAMFSITCPAPGASP